MRRSTGISSTLALAALVLLSSACEKPTIEVQPVRAPHLAANVWPSTGTRLIYDGDMGPDPCDFTTLSMLHEYHRRGMIELLGVVGSTPEPDLASTFGLYNYVYGNEIAIGAYRRGSRDVPYNRSYNWSYNWSYNRSYNRSYSWATRFMYWIAIGYTTYTNPNRIFNERFANAGSRAAEGALGSLEAYRKLLSQAEDGSVTLYVAGPLFNFPALLASGGDRYSPLGGDELLAEKVKELVFMGGYFPASSDVPLLSAMSGSEYNWWALGNDRLTQRTLAALVALGKPVTYVGFEVGERIRVGKEVVRRLGRDHPTSEAYFQYRSTYDGAGDVLSNDNPAFDDVALYYIVEGGIGRYFRKVTGSVRIDESGANTWVEGGETQSYLALLPGVENELAGVITDRITGEF